MDPYTDRSNMRRSLAEIQYMISEETTSSRHCDYSIFIHPSAHLGRGHPTRALPLMHSAVVTRHLRQPAPSSTLGYQYRSTSLGRSLIAAITRHQTLTLCNIPLEYKGADPGWGLRGLNGFPPPCTRICRYPPSPGSRLDVAGERNCWCRNAAGIANFGIDCSCKA